MPKRRDCGVRRHAGVEETRQQLPSLLDDAHAGKPVVITKHGKPYAAIVPLEALHAATARRH
jgi:prevent-host-death family protein